MKHAFGFLFVVIFVGMPSAEPAYGSFHFMQIEQVIGGVSGDTTAQAIQLRMRSPNQTQMAMTRLVVSDATGANPVVVIDFGSNVTNGSTGARILNTSANFANYTDVALNSDFTMQNLIPASYLAAGSLTFENDLGTLIYWRLSWGGPGYTGSNAGANTNDADGFFGPAVLSPLPTGTSALQFQGTASALSTFNFADYAPSDDPAVFTNNANESFAIDIAVPTVSDWGLAVMMLVVLTTGSIVIKRRGRRSVAKPLH